MLKKSFFWWKKRISSDEGYSVLLNKFYLLYEDKDGQIAVQREDPAHRADGNIFIYFSVPLTGDFKRASVSAERLHLVSQRFIEVLDFLKWKYEIR